MNELLISAQPGLQAGSLRLTEVSLWIIQNWNSIRNYHKIVGGLSTSVDVVILKRMRSPATYSARTKCPECHARVRLENITFKPSFPCPACGKDICVATGYRRLVFVTAWVLGVLIPYFVGLKWWAVLVCWVPLAQFLALLWMYGGIYIIPPPLKTCRFDAPSTLGIGR